MPDRQGRVDSFLAAVADKSNQPVFIHCGSANRVGGMWMIKRVLQDGWADRPGARPRPRRSACASRR